MTSELLNFVYFGVGLAVGLFGLWPNQKYFQAQQQDKFDQIATDIRDLRERLMVLSETASERTQAREDRLLTMAMQKEAVSTATEQAAADIRVIVADELRQANLPDALERTQRLEKEVSKILARSNERLIEVGEEADAETRLRRLSATSRMALQAVKDRPFTVDYLEEYYGRKVDRLSLLRHLGDWLQLGLVDPVADGYVVADEVKRVMDRIPVSEHFGRGQG
jgi:hypothetical protein